MTTRYTTEHMNRSNGGTVTAADFGAVAHEAGADRDDLRTLLAQGRTKGYGPAPCAPDEVSTEDHAAALVGYDGASRAWTVSDDVGGRWPETITAPDASAALDAAEQRVRSQCAAYEGATAVRITVADDEGSESRTVTL